MKIAFFLQHFRMIPQIKQKATIRIAYRILSRAT